MPNLRPLLRAISLGAAVAVSAAACGSVGTPSGVTPMPSKTHSSCPTAAPAPMAAGKSSNVEIKTSKGAITIKVEADLGPLAAANFVALAGCGFYDGVVFHRLVPGFVIQGGDPTGTGGGGPGYTFADDPVTVPYQRGIVAMANSGPATNGSQFFIVLADAALGPNYSVFGRVTGGMATVDAIAAMPNSGPPDNLATSPVAMDSVTVTNP